MFWNLLTSVTSVASGDSSATAPKGGCDVGSVMIFGVFAILIIVMSIYSRRTQKKREEELNKTLDAIQPGSKVKTIGGICGIVVEVCPEDSTFILETGSEKSGKSYLKLDKKSIYQTDAVPAPAEEKAEETAPVEEEKEAPVDETEKAPVDETKDEE